MKGENIKDLAQLFQTLSENNGYPNRLIVIKQPNNALKEPMLYLPEKIYDEWVERMKKHRDDLDFPESLSEFVDIQLKDL